MAEFIENAAITKDEYLYLSEIVNSLIKKTQIYIWLKFGQQRFLC